MKKFYIIMLFMYCVQHVAAQANQNLSNLTSPTAVNVALLPQSDNSLNLGSAGNSWKNIYLDGSIYMDGLRFIAYKAGTGTGNTALGSIALNSNTTDINNTVTGYQALYSNTTGYGADANSADLTNTTALGNLTNATASNQVHIGNTNVTALH